jgi:hypothetical protein
MNTIKRLLCITLVLALGAGHAPGTASFLGWVETFATVTGTQHQQGSVVHLDFGVQNNSSATQDIEFAGVIRFSDGTWIVTQHRESMTLLPGDGVIRFGSFILPQNAPLGPAEFLVGAAVHGPAATLQGPRFVLDRDIFDIVP